MGKATGTGKKERSSAKHTAGGARRLTSIVTNAASPKSSKARANASSTPKSSGRLSKGASPSGWTPPTSKKAGGSSVSSSKSKSKSKAKLSPEQRASTTATVAVAVADDSRRENTSASTNNGKDKKKKSKLKKGASASASTTAGSSTSATASASESTTTAEMVSNSASVVGKGGNCSGKNNPAAADAPTKDGKGVATPAANGSGSSSVFTQEGALFKMICTCPHLLNHPRRMDLLRKLVDVRIEVNTALIVTQRCTVGAFGAMDGQGMGYPAYQCRECEVHTLDEADHVLTCLDCGYTGCGSPPNRHLFRHCLTQPGGGHNFATNRARGELFCAECCDYVYDAEFDAAVSRADDEFGLPKEGGSGGSAGGEIVGGDANVIRGKRRRRARSDGHYLVTDRFGQQPWRETAWPPPVLLSPGRGRLAAAGVRGMFNLGNTCFMSSVLQAVLHITVMQSFFFTNGHDPVRCEKLRKETSRLRSQIRQFDPDATFGLPGGSSGGGGGGDGCGGHGGGGGRKSGSGAKKLGEYCMACELARLFRDMFSTEAVTATLEDAEPYVPNRLLEAVWGVSDLLAGYEQQDAHEFLIAVLDNLDGHLHRAKYNEASAPELRRTLAAHKQRAKQLQQQQKKAAEAAATGGGGARSGGSGGSRRGATGSGHGKGKGSPPVEGSSVLSENGVGGLPNSSTEKKSRKRGRKSIGGAEAASQVAEWFGGASGDQTPAGDEEGLSGLVSLSPPLKTAKGSKGKWLSGDGGAGGGGTANGSRPSKKHKAGMATSPHWEDPKLSSPLLSSHDPREGSAADAAISEGATPAICPLAPGGFAKGGHAFSAISPFRQSSMSAHGVTIAFDEGETEGENDGTAAATAAALAGHGSRSNGQRLEDLNLRGFVQEVFAGVTRSDVVCTACGDVSCTYERSLEVSLPVRAEGENCPPFYQRRRPGASAASPRRSPARSHSNGVARGSSGKAAARAGAGVGAAARVEGRSSSPPMASTGVCDGMNGTSSLTVVGELTLPDTTDGSTTAPSASPSTRQASAAQAPPPQARPRLPGRPGVASAVGHTNSDANCTLGNGSSNGAHGARVVSSSSSTTSSTLPSLLPPLPLTPAGSSRCLDPLIAGSGPGTNSPGCLEEASSGGSRATSVTGRMSPTSSTLSSEDSTACGGSAGADNSIAATSTGSGSNGENVFIGSKDAFSATSAISSSTTGINGEAFSSVVGAEVDGTNTGGSDSSGAGKPSPKPPRAAAVETGEKGTGARIGRSSPPPISPAPPGRPGGADCKKGDTLEEGNDDGGDDFKFRSITDCFATFSASEQLAARMHCDSCAGSVLKTKQMSFCSLPRVLVLHLKRFDAMADRKIDDFISFPARGLDMGKYLTGWPGTSTSPAPTESGNLHLSSCSPMPAAATPGAAAKSIRARGAVPAPCVPYDLHAVVNHSGSMAQGHYTAFVKELGRWFRFDDTWVREVDEAEVLASEAYLLFYFQRGADTRWKPPHTSADYCGGGGEGGAGYHNATASTNDDHFLDSNAAFFPSQANLPSGVSLPSKRKR